jgi:hypothetical protein
MKIWKFPLNVEDAQTINMPLNAEILHVAAQTNTPNLWALVDENADLEPRHFVTFGTGEPMPENGYGSYVGTYQLHDGALVFHVFEA